MENTETQLFTSTRNYYKDHNDMVCTLASNPKRPTLPELFVSHSC